MSEQSTLLSMTNKKTILAGFFTGIGLACSVPVMAIVFKVCDALLKLVVAP